MLNVFEEAFTAQKDLSNKPLTESVQKPAKTPVVEAKKFDTAVVEKNLKKLGIKFGNWSDTQAKRQLKSLCSAADTKKVYGFDITVSDGKPVLLIGIHLRTEDKAEVKDFIMACTSCLGEKLAGMKVRKPYISYGTDDAYIEYEIKLSKDMLSENVGKVALNKIVVTEEVEPFEPDEGLLVVFNPDISDDMSDEELDAVADDMIGKNICKCGVCGANYTVASETDMNDEVVIDENDIEEAEDAEITPAEEIAIEEPETLDSDVAEEEEANPAGDNDFDDMSESLLFRNFLTEADDDESTPAEAEENAEENTDGEDADTESEEIINGDEATEADDEECCELICPICGAKEGQLIIGEIAPVEEIDDGDEITEPTEENEAGGESDDEEIPLPTDDDVPTEVDDIADVEYDSIEFDESALNRLFTKFACENYDNVKSVKFTNGRVVCNNIHLEGVVTTKSGRDKKIVLTSEGFDITKNPRIIRFIERGPFTEKAHVATGRVPFVVECQIKDGKTIMCNTLKYSYKVNEGIDTYEVSGRTQLNG